MPTFVIAGQCQDIVGKLFRSEQDRRLTFGWTAQSISPTNLSDIFSAPVRFRDYIMEGFVVYTVKVDDMEPGCRLSVVGEGSNRDWSILPQVRHYILAAKMNLVSETSD